MLDDPFPGFNLSPPFHAATSSAVDERPFPPWPFESTTGDTSFANDAAQHAAPLAYDPAVSLGANGPDNSSVKLSRDRPTSGCAGDVHSRLSSFIPTSFPREALEISSNATFPRHADQPTEDRAAIDTLSGPLAVVSLTTRNSGVQSSQSRTGAVSTPVSSGP